MKTTHKILLLLAILLILAAPALASNGNIPIDAAESKGVSILLNGQVMKTEPMSFIDPASNHTLVPIRFVTESLGAKVKWEEKDRSITVIQGDKTIVMKIDSRDVFINASKKTLNPGLSPKLINSRTMVPFRFLSETFGYEVGFDKEKTMPTIVTKQTSTVTPVPASLIHKIAEANGAISIDTSGPVVYKKMELENPKRIVFDLLDAQINNSYQEYNFNIDELKKMRVSQFDSDIYGKDRDVVRLVLDIDESYKNPDVKVNNGNNNLSLSINSKGKIEIKPPVEVKPPVNKPAEDTKKPEEEKVVIAPPTTGKRMIVIDPGHGGKDGGCFQNGIAEKDVVLSISKKLNTALANNNYIPIMTRDKDNFIELVDRPLIANKAGANMFLSIHANSATPAASGVEVWYNSLDKKYSKGAESKVLAKTLSDEIAAKTGANNRGAKESNGFAVLKRTEVPSALIEVGFLSNKEESKLLIQDQYQNKIVQAIVDGVNKFFSL